MPDVYEADFFSKMPEIIELYESLKHMLLDRYPGTSISVQKSQIAFRSNGHPYCRVWLPTFRKIKGFSGSYMIITLGLRRRLESPRVVQAVEPYPDRWTHHIPINSISELDIELFAWIDEARAMIGVK